MSPYRPSGKLVGSHLNAAERRARVENDRRIFLEKLDKLRVSYHCPGDNCAAPLATLTYGTTQVTHTMKALNEYQRDLDVTSSTATATLTCTRGHIRTEVLP